MKTVRISLAALAGIALACASAPTPVTVTGGAADRASLAGKWTGEYSSPVTGRSGSIVFNLSHSGDVANGDVAEPSARAARHPPRLRLEPGE